jgi:hypothetical protein
MGRLLYRSLGACRFPTAPPRVPRVGYAGGGGTTCGVDVYPWAPTGAADPIRDAFNDPVTPTGVTWDTLKWGTIAREDIDNGLAAKSCFHV